MKPNGAYDLVACLLGHRSVNQQVKSSTSTFHIYTKFHVVKKITLSAKLKLGGFLSQRG